MSAMVVVAVISSCVAVVSVAVNVFFNGRLERYRREGAREIEAIRTQTARQLDDGRQLAAAQLETVKATLQRDAFEYQTRFARLHERRLEVAAGFCRLLAVMEVETRHYVSRVSDTLDLPDEFRAPDATAVWKAIADLDAYLGENGVYLSESLADKIGAFAGRAREATGRLPEEPDWVDAKKLGSLSSAAPKLRREIEREFRAMVGTPAPGPKTGA